MHGPKVGPDTALSTPHPRRRLLLIAYACSPRHGSEPMVGWHRALQAARFHDTWVICEEHRFGPEVREYLRTHGPVSGLRFEFLPMTGPQQLLARTSVLYYLAYNLWHRDALKLARRLHARHDFDLVHQVNYCGFREPGYCWQLEPPFVWGPLGGTQNMPLRFLGELGAWGAVKELVRTALNHWQLRFRRRVRQAARRADVILAANTTNQRDLRRAHGVLPEVLLETGLPKIAACAHRDVASAVDSPRDLHILWSGQFLPFKGLTLLLKALGGLRGRLPFQLRVLGDGPMRRAWSRLARRLGIEDRVQWLGWLPHAEAMEQYAWADVFAFTSLRDTTGSVMLEALAAGVPVICLDHQGGRDVVTDSSGWRIPPNRPGQVVADLQTVLLRAVRDRAYLAEMQRGARQRAERYLWSCNGEQMANVYERVLGGGVAGVPEREEQLA
ncbi:MAG: glycosyltransferase [Pirellulaceae bacterium]|nr:glycosyltransferase [Pirellulaceae bacterium]